MRIDLEEREAFFEGGMIVGGAPFMPGNENMINKLEQLIDEWEALAADCPAPVGTGGSLGLCPPPPVRMGMGAKKAFRPLCSALPTNQLLGVLRVPPRPAILASAPEGGWSSVALLHLQPINSPAWLACWSKIKERNAPMGRITGLD